MLTGDEANEAYERAFLQARHEVWLALPRLDPDLPLLSAQAQRVGTDWGALVSHTLGRGVQVNLLLSDTDPFADAGAHQRTHACARRLRAANPRAGERLRISTLMHPARLGAVTRTGWGVGARWAGQRRQMRATLALLGSMTPEARAEALLDMPGLAPHLTGADGPAPRLRRTLLPPLAAARHHHRLMVVDRHSLILGGPDSDPAAAGYGLRLVREGTSAADAQAHLEHFAEVSAGRADPGTHRHLLRTLTCPSRRPGGLVALRSDIANAHAALARRAEDLIYIETRRLTDPKLVHALAAAAAARPGLGLIVMLPGEGAANGGPAGAPPAAQTDALRQLARAYGNRFFAGQATVPISPAGQRLAIFDRRAALLGSADLTPEALHVDTEAGLYIRTMREIGEIAGRVGAYWMARTATAAPIAGTSVVSLWKARAESGGGRMRPYPLN
ncbi:phospholipase D-like domain-containing protein [Acidimangrovimonas sediminis]|uniref:hypothetical protein n=1 Tax=Acidimangrovimonas sediminis TaxID=2056283 RepID=UPI000C80E4B0|nr:hypothetical protein [Acidimangrovimonas sediminis]